MNDFKVLASKKDLTNLTKEQSEQMKQHLKKRMKAICEVIDGHLEYLKLRTGNDFQNYNYS